MKKQTLLVASFCLIIGLAVAPAYAESGGVQAKIPFNFTVAGKTFRAGAYTMIVGSHQVDIRDAYGRKIVMVLANEISGHRGGTDGQIIFHCYSESCFLSEVWFPTHEKRTSVAHFSIRRRPGEKGKRKVLRSSRSGTSEVVARRYRCARAGRSRTCSTLTTKKFGNAREPSTTGVTGKFVELML